MTTVYTYPTSATLREIAQDKMPRLIQNRPIFDLLPVRDDDAYVLMWEQLDNYQGLQQARGLGGKAPRVARTGMKRYTQLPGVYGEYESIDEVELTQRRQIGTFATPTDISDLVMMKQDKLLQRRLDRIEWIGWNLLCNGIFTVLGPNGLLIHQDMFAMQSYTSSVPWSTPATATPLADARALKLLHRGHSVSFGADSTEYMNQTTFNQMISNTNPADLYGRRTTGLATYENMQQVNTLLQGDDLPKISIYDEGYLSDGQDGNTAGTFQLYIPTGISVVAGRRPAGQTVGEYRMTRNVNNASMGPGPYMKVIDNVERDVPREIAVHDGHNGGPVIFFPSAIVVKNVS